nr:putative cladoceran-specific protein type 1 [Daphnia magna]
MKFALILLLGLLVFSNQQFFQLLENERLLWWLFHYPPRPVFHNYNYQPVKNHDLEDSRAATYIDRWSHSPGIPAYSQDKQPYLNAMENVNNVNEDQFPDVQSRGKLGKGRFLPSFFQRLKAQYNHPRIIISKASRTNLLKKMKTVTFTLVSTLTIVTVQSCIPISEFASGWAGAMCRKRRGFLESSDSKSETSQFAIAPSGVQPVEQTVLSSPRDPTAAENGPFVNGPFVNDPAVNHGVISSKDEDILDDFSNVTLKAVGVEPTVISALNLLTENAELPLISSSKDEDLLNEKQSSQEMPLSKQSRMKRLFFHFVTTTTVVSYTFFSATSTKTVNLLSVVGQRPGYLICRPEGFSVCSSTSTINT